jgi:hypothetical protein
MTEAAKPDVEWSCALEPSLRDVWRTDPDGDMDLLRSIDSYNGRGEPPFGWVKTPYPSIVQKIARKVDRKKPQCFACHVDFVDWRSGLERAHIVAASAGGEDVTSNYVLLCSDCHIDSPMTNRVDWMHEWVDRGPAASGWQEHDARDWAINAELLAIVNYSARAYGREYSDLNEFLGFTLEGADTSIANMRRTVDEVLKECRADFHFGQRGFSPSTWAFVIIEAWGRVVFGNPERKGLPNGSRVATDAGLED